MIPTSQKFPLRTEFIRFRAQAKRATSTHLVVYSSDLPAASLAARRVCSEAKDRSELWSHSRLAVIVPKKVSKLATTRNYLKRLTYDILYPRIKDARLDVVVVYKPLLLARTPSLKSQIVSEIKSLNIV